MRFSLGIGWGNNREARHRCVEVRFKRRFVGVYVLTYTPWGSAFERRVIEVCASGVKLGKAVYSGGYRG